MYPLESLSTMKWPDAVDILILSFLIHRLLVLFRGTATLHVSAALALLGVLLELARAFNFVLTSRFLEALGTVAVLVIVVAFRDEIREVLIQTNPVRLFLGRPNHRVDARRLHAAVEATFRMAETRTGALLVFQGRGRLAQHLRDGVVVGGQVSVAMLQCIFSKESPVHDGATVIRGNKIERVGAILPLTRSPDVPPEFGTRHRAAIGLSEVSDAVVVVVSEERGEVSVVHRGAVSAAGSPEALEAMLQRHLGWDAEGRRLREIRREFLRQVAGFALTTLAVVAYWSIFFGQQVSVTNVTVPIDFRNLPAGMELGRISNEKVDIQIRGQRPLIEDLKLHPERVGVSVDLRQVEPGTGQTLHLSPENIELPVGLEVVRLTPTSLVIDLQRLVSKVVPVRPRFRPGLPEGLEVVVEPRGVQVIGPESELGALSEVTTEWIEPVAPSPEQREVSRTAILSAPEDSVRLGKDQPRQVRVTIRRPPPEPHETGRGSGDPAPPPDPPGEAGGAPRPPEGP